MCITQAQRREYTGTAGYDSPTILYDPAALDRSKPYFRAFWLTQAFAAHVLSLEKQKYGKSYSAVHSQYYTDTITGFLTHCLWDQNLVPHTESRTQFVDFVRMQGTTNTDIRLDGYRFGWGLELAGLPWPLTHEYDDQLTPLIITLVSQLPNLTAGEKNSLISILQTVQAAFERGDTTTAVNRLQAFINNVRTLRNSGRAAANDAASLINQAAGALSMVYDASTP